MTLFITARQLYDLVSYFNVVLYCTKKLLDERQTIRKLIFLMNSVSLFTKSYSVEAETGFFVE